MATIDPTVLAKKIHEDTACVESAVEQIKYFDELKQLEVEIANVNQLLQTLQDRRANIEVKMNQAATKAQNAIQSVITSLSSQ